MDTEKIIELLSNLDKTNQLALYLIIIVGVNILVVIVKFFLDIKLKNHDKSIHKKNILISKSIDIEEQLYEKLDSLTLLDKSQNNVLLEKIQEIEFFVSKNKLHLSTKIYKHTHEVLDYFKSVLTNYRKKNYQTEIDLLNQYVKYFRK